MSGSFELVPDEPACAFLAFGGHSRIVDSGPAQKLARYLAENRRKIFERFRTEQQHATLDEDELVVLHETTKAGAWLGGVAYPQGAVAGSFTLDGQGARVTVLKPRDPSALKVPSISPPLNAPVAHALLYLAPRERPLGIHIRPKRRSHAVLLRRCQGRHLAPSRLRWHLHICFLFLLPIIHAEPQLDMEQQYRPRLRTWQPDIKFHHELRHAFAQFDLE